MSIPLSPTEAAAAYRAAATAQLEARVALVRARTIGDGGAARTAEHELAARRVELYSAIASLGAALNPRRGGDREMPTLRRAYVPASKG